jgi:hypothetical protein
MLFVLPNQLRIDFGTAHYSPEDALYRRMVGHSLFVAYLLTPRRRLGVEWHAPSIEDAHQTDKCVDLKPIKSRLPVWAVFDSPILWKGTAARTGAGLAI